MENIINWLMQYKEWLWLFNSIIVVLILVVADWLYYLRDKKTLNGLEVEPQALQERLKELTQKLQESEERYNALNEAWRKSTAPLDQAADQAFQQGNWEKAARLLDQSLEKQNQEVAERHYRRGEVFLRQFQPESALSHLEKAWDLQPENHQYGMAYAIALQGQNHFDKAIQVGNMVLQKLRHLATQQPDPFLLDVVHVLNCLGNAYRDTRRTREAEAAYKEALEIRRKCGKPKTEGYKKDVSLMLNNLGTLYGSNERPGEAEAVLQEALTIRRSLAYDTHASHLPDLAISLNNLADVYYGSQRYNDAETVYKEALTAYRMLGRKNPTAYRADMAATMTSLGNVYRDTQQNKEAESVYKDALDIYRTLSLENPDAYRQNMALILNHLGNLYGGTNRWAEAEEAYQEALGIRRLLAQDNPSAFRPDVAMTLYNLAVLYKNTKRWADAEAALKNALDLQRKLYHHQPSAHAERLNIMLGAYSRLLERLKRPQEQLQIEAERAGLAKGR